MTKKTTNIDLPKELKALDPEKYRDIISLAEQNYFHDFKSVDSVAPKMELVQALESFPELNHIKQEVMNGIYDESPDEEDKAAMKKMLRDNGGESIAGILGLD